MTSFAKFRKFGVTRFAVLLAASMMLSALAIAQSSQSQPANASESQVSAAPSAGGDADQAKVGQSKEAPAEDETTPFKHSPSVQFLAKITGLSIDGAYWLAVVLNFAIVAGVVIWFSQKNVPGMLRSHHSEVAGRSPHSQ
jgi:hypothetical protein